MGIKAQMRDLLRLRTEDEPLLRAQLHAMERQIPLLYIIILTNVWALGIHFLDTAPQYLTLYLPITTTFFIATRMVHWGKRAREEKSIDVVISKLKALFVLCVVITAILSGWAWSLDSYANDLQRAHITFFVAVILTSSAFALAQYPLAAVSSLWIGGLTFLSYSASGGSLVQFGLGVNFLVVLAIVTILLATFNKSFVASVHAQENMAKANAEMSNLNEQLIFHRDNLAQEVEKQTAELREQAVKLEQALSHEKELNQMQTRFVSMVSHEFRTPLTVIDATARRVERRHGSMASEEIEDRMTKVRSSVRRLSGLVDRTLDASKMANGAIEYNPVSFDVSKLLQDVLEHQSEVSPAAQIRLKTDCLPKEMMGDPHLIDHMFSNIISNAIKYSPDIPVIKVSLVGDGDRLTFTVKDHGVGIPRAELAKVTNRFYRASTSNGIPGTGIGLNFVASLVDMHNGCFCIDSEEGAWTKVSINLPIDGRTRKSVCGKSCSTDEEIVGVA